MKNVFKEFTNAITAAPRAVAGLATGAVAGASGRSASEGWQEGWGKPKETTDTWTDQASPYVNQYAPMVAGGALSLMGMPFMGAGLMTAMQGYQGYDQTGKVDWNKVGRDALVNYGTAGIAAGADKLLSSASSAQKLSSGTSQMGKGLTAANTASDAASGLYGSQALGRSLADTSALSGFSGTSANALKSSSAGALSRLGPVTGVSTSSLIPRANSVQSSGGVTSNPGAPAPQSTISKFGDNAYTGAVKAGEKVLTTGLTSTLAPTGTKPIAGMDAESDSTNTNGAGNGSGYQFGDVLGAFGAGAYEPNPGGYRIGVNESKDIMSSLGSNYLLRESGLSDTFKPTGQIDPDPNTPYTGQMVNLRRSTDKALSDANNEINNYNKYFAIMDANPGLATEEIMNQYIANPELAPENMRPYFKDIRPMSMFNTSMIR